MVDREIENLRSLRKNLRQIERALDRGLKTGHSSGCCGVGLAQCHALLAIPKEGRELSELSRDLGVDASTLTRTLDGLETALLVSRHANDADRRRGRVLLTKTGISKVGQIDETWNSWLGAALQKLAVDKRKLVLEGVDLLALALSQEASSAEVPCC